MKKIDFFFFPLLSPPTLSWENFLTTILKHIFSFRKSGGSFRIFPSKSFCWKSLARFNHLTYRNRGLQAIHLYIDCKIWTWKDPANKAEEWGTNKLKAKMFTVTGASDESLLQLCVSATFLSSILQMLCVWQFTASLSSPLGHYSACIGEWGIKSTRKYRRAVSEFEASHWAFSFQFQFCVYEWIHTTLWSYRYC